MKDRTYPNGDSRDHCDWIIHRNNANIATTPTHNEHEGELARDWMRWCERHMKHRRRCSGPNCLGSAREWSMRDEK
jgi:hypothetical protein